MSLAATATALSPTVTAYGRPSKPFSLRHPSFGVDLTLIFTVCAAFLQGGVCPLCDCWKELLCGKTGLDGTDGKKDRDRETEKAPFIDTPRDAVVG